MDHTLSVKAAGYYRISTLSKGQDLDNQRVPIAEYAKARNLELTNHYQDEGISGAKERRPGLDNLLRDARLGKFKVIIVAEISRLARDVRHLLNLLHELTELGVEVHSLREAINLGSSYGRALVAMIGVLVTVERDLLRERIKSALYTKRLLAEQAGKQFKIGRPSIVTPEVGQKILSLRMSGHSIRQISKLMTGQVGKSTVERVLRDQRNGLSQKSLQVVDKRTVKTSNKPTQKRDDL